MDDLQNINLFDEQPETPNPESPGDGFSRSLSRSNTNVIISGTCAGIAEYFNTDPVVIRILFILGMLFGMWIAGLYIVAAFMLPPARAKNEIPPEQMEMIRKVNFRTVLSGVLLFTGLYLAFRFFGIIERFHLFYFSESISFAIISVATGVFFIVKNPSAVLPARAENKKLFRSVNDAKILGVCGGLSKYIDFDSSSLRILFLLMFFLTAGIFGIFYLITAVLVPSEKEDADA